MTYVPPPTEPPAIRPLNSQFAYKATGGSFALLLIKNIALTVITFGIYSFWARTDIRRFIWGNTELDGHRFRYTGTGKELFFGAIKLALIYTLLVITGTLLRLLGTVGGVVVVVLVIAIVLCGYPSVVYWARRYRFSRTSYRNISFGMRRGWSEIVKPSVVEILLVIVTLGFYFPVFNNRLHKRLTNRSFYGGDYFEYTGSDKEAFIIFIKAFFLVPLTLGIWLFFYRAEMMRFRWRNTRYLGLQFTSTIDGGDLILIAILALFGIPLTLGLAAPWILTYAMRTIMSNLHVRGQVDLDKVQQSAAAGSALGDVLGDAFDIAIDI